jgi:hypothetical protein
LLVDGEHHAIGLIFAGASGAPELTQDLANPATDKPQKIEGYGVANPIGEVLDKLKIELLI